ncbi:carbohydrate-binding family 9-like protein [Saccharibacillus sp. CPCC 101409]|uniref:carbohydrate-binding family 9-like protein n=1 Tax=Saccharibacillus sp. CPCC 101409 TaxID=3058041 RepID=UPI00267237F7|nr:carbohydrate-binding family 9-like protein [Saccharibacillus sp. CPCC 101409]MDO3411734.1 carbohydrate-binding family 9-like protein [Saccharibacillus sp. CPCC 101409]
MNLGGVPEPAIEFAPRSYVCRRANGKPELDGRLDKPFWADAPWTEEFVDIEGDRKPRPHKSTRVKMLWDDEYFYFGAQLEEDEIWATLTERESVIFYDNDFEIFIDPDGDTHQYYEFEINALNTVWDLLLVTPYRDGGPPINGWDIRGLRTAVHIDGELNNPDADNRSWSVEVAMPWSILRECAEGQQPPEAGANWRVNFSRVQWRVDKADGAYRKVINPETGRPYPEDNWVWSPQGVINMHYPELWGYVLFADGETPESFELPDDEIVKWKLRRLYYRQRNHYERSGVFADRIEPLLEAGDENGELAGLAAEGLLIETTSRSFRMRAASADGAGAYWIREDGKLWKE